MNNKELESLILRAIVNSLADLVLERLRCGAIAPVQTDGAGRMVCGGASNKNSANIQRTSPVPFIAGGRLDRVFGREEAVFCEPGGEVHIARHMLITPLAADELDRRRVRVVRV